MAVKFKINTPVDVSITPANVTYTANDVIGGVLTFAPSASKGKIVAISISDNDGEGAALVLWLFSSITTTIADDGAFAPVIADLTAQLGKITIASNDYVTVNSLKTAYIPLTIPIPFDGSFQGYLVDTAGSAWGASKTIAIRLHIEGES